MTLCPTTSFSLEADKLTDQIKECNKYQISYVDYFGDLTRLPILEICPIKANAFSNYEELNTFRAKDKATKEKDRKTFDKTLNNAPNKTGNWNATSKLGPAGGRYKRFYGYYGCKIDDTDPNNIRLVAIEPNEVIADPKDIIMPVKGKKMDWYRTYNTYLIYHDVSTRADEFRLSDLPSNYLEKILQMKDNKVFIPSTKFLRLLSDVLGDLRFDRPVTQKESANGYEEKEENDDVSDIVRSKRTSRRVPSPESGSSPPVSDPVDGKDRDDLEESTKKKMEFEKMLQTPTTRHTKFVLKPGKQYIYCSSKRACLALGVYLNYFSNGYLRSYNGESRKDLQANSLLGIRYMFFTDKHNCTLYPLNKIIPTYDGKGLKESEIKEIASSSKENANGEIFPIILATEESYKGQDMKGITTLRVMDSFLDIQDLLQFIGRGPRMCSHTELSESKAKVSLHLYVTLPDQENADEFDDEMMAAGSIFDFYQAGGEKRDIDDNTAENSSKRPKRNPYGRKRYNEDSDPDVPNKKQAIVKHQQLFLDSKREDTDLWLLNASRIDYQKFWLRLRASFELVAWDKKYFENIHKNGMSKMINTLMDLDIDLKASPAVRDPTKVKDDIIQACIRNAFLIFGLSKKFKKYEKLLCLNTNDAAFEQMKEKLEICKAAINQIAHLDFNKVTIAYEKDEPSRATISVNGFSPFTIDTKTQGTVITGIKNNLGKIYMTTMAEHFLDMDTNDEQLNIILKKEIADDTNTGQVESLLEFKDAKIHTSNILQNVDGDSPVYDLLGECDDLGLCSMIASNNLNTEYEQLIIMFKSFTSGVAPSDETKTTFIIEYENVAKKYQDIAEKFSEKNIEKSFYLRSPMLQAGIYHFVYKTLKEKTIESFLPNFENADNLHYAALMSLARNDFLETTERDFFQKLTTMQTAVVSENEKNNRVKEEEKAYLLEKVEFLLDQNAKVEPQFIDKIIRLNDLKSLAISYKQKYWSVRNNKIALQNAYNIARLAELPKGVKTNIIKKLDRMYEDAIHAINIKSLFVRIDLLFADEKYSPDKQSGKNAPAFTETYDSLIQQRNEIQKHDPAYSKNDVKLLQKAYENMKNAWKKVAEKNSKRMDANLYLKVYMELPAKSEENFFEKISCTVKDLNKKDINAVLENPYVEGESKTFFKSLQEKIKKLTSIDGNIGKNSPAQEIAEYFSTELQSPAPLEETQSPDPTDMEV